AWMHLRHSSSCHAYRASLHDALPIFIKSKEFSLCCNSFACTCNIDISCCEFAKSNAGEILTRRSPTVIKQNNFFFIEAWCNLTRSDEPTSALQSRFELVCRPLLENTT